MSPIVKQKYPIKLRGTAMEEFKIFEATLFNLSPCAAQWYRGSAHRARGLNVQYKLADEIPFSTPPLLRATSSVWLMPPPRSIGVSSNNRGRGRGERICQGRESGGILFLSPATAM